MISRRHASPETGMSDPDVQYLGFILLPCAEHGLAPNAQYVKYERAREDKQWRTWLSACRGDEELGELTLRDAAAVELLQALGKVAHEQHLTVEVEVLHAAAAAASTAVPAAGDDTEAAATAAAGTPAGCQAHSQSPDGPAAHDAGTSDNTNPITSSSSGGNSSSSVQLPCDFVRLRLCVSVSLLHHGVWRRSPAAATLFKQLFPCDTELGSAVQQVMLPRLSSQQQQQQQQDKATASTARYTLLSCFRELPSVSTAPPPTAITIQQQHLQQPQQQPQPQHQHQAAGVAAATTSKSSCTTTSLADVPQEVMGQLLSLLTARDLAALALTCRGLRASTWEAVPGLLLVLYPHQRHALSWMLHREVNGGQQQPHPFIRQHLTAGGAGGWPVYLNQLTGEMSVDPPEPLADVRGGFFCDEPGLGKTVTALSLILKTQGTVPSAPPGATVSWIHSPDGRRLGYYTPPDPAAACLNPDTANHPSDAAFSLSRRHSSGTTRRNSSSGSFASLAAVGGGRARRGSSSNSRQGSAWQLAPSLRGGSTTRRARSAAAGTAPAAAAAAAGGGGGGGGGGGAAAGGGGGAAAAGGGGGGEGDSVSADVLAADRVTGACSSSMDRTNDSTRQQQQTMRVTRQLSATAGGSAAAHVNNPPEQSAAKRQKLASGFAAHHEQQPVVDRTQQQQQQQEADTAAAAAAAASPAAAAGDDSDHVARTDVQCDHCSKWRRLPVGFKLLDSDPDLPWYCCLHPEPHMASCLVPEEPHDMNTAAAADPAHAHISYDSCIGYIPAGPAAAASSNERHAENVAHFSGVINAAANGPGVEGSLQVLGWLAQQNPDALLSGVTVPRHVREEAPDYGRLFSMMSLQLASTAAAAAAAAAAATSAVKPPRSAATASKASANSSSSSKKKKKTAKFKKKRSRRSSSSSSNEDYATEIEDDVTDNDSLVQGGKGVANGVSGGPGAASSRQQQKQKQPTRAVTGSGGKGRAQRLSGAAAAAAAHKWCQPHSLCSLSFDVAALKQALAQGTGSAPRVFLSSATLVIVPVTLIPHWQQQIRQHLLPRRLRVLVLGSATAVAAGQDTAAAAGSRGRTRALKASSTASGGGGAAESVCPPAHELAWGYDVVITTFQRLSSDWSMRSDPQLAERLVLLKVHWLRIIVDEGHSLGASMGLTNKLAMAVQLTAQRRWVMTGTPTPATSAGSGAAYLQPLLSFLHQEPFGSSSAVWSGAVAKPLEAAGDAGRTAAAAAAAGGGPASVVTSGVMDAEWGRQQLMGLLSRVMIRSCKADLALLPPCYKKVTLLDFAPDHAKSYNALVEVIRRNLLLADWCDDTHTESILSAQQSRWAKEMLSNIRKACCVAGGMNLVAKEEDVLECLQLLAGKLEVPPPSKEQHVVVINTQQAQQTGADAMQQQQQQTEADNMQQQQQQQTGADAMQQQQQQQTEADAMQQQQQQQHDRTASTAGAGSSAGVGVIADPPVGDTAAEAAGADTAAAAAAAAAADADDGGAAVATPAAAAAAAAAVLSGVVLRRRWYYTGPGHPLHAIEEALREGCICQVCQEWSPFPLVTPCGHLQCTDCSAVSRTRCRVCAKPFTMQPVDDPARYLHNPNPKWEVPLELIEWQPVYHQAGATGSSGGEWSGNWRITRSTKVLHLMQRLVEVGVYTPHRTHPMGEAPAAAAAATLTATGETAATAAAAGETAAASAGGEGLASAGADGPAASSVSSVSRCLKGSSSRAAAGAHHHPQLLLQQQQQQVKCAGPVKAIVFSQFWMHVQLIAAELSARGVHHFVLKSDMAARDKQAAVMAFRATPSNCCLLMDASGALGLDLSFVRYIFLMEPLADASLEQQVVSRAHRMGATAPVHVELFAMRHTAEEHMVELRYEAASGRLSGSAADVAASSAAAAVANASDALPGTAAAAAAAATDINTPGQQQHQQQATLLGGATATAKAVSLSNITDFVAVGAGEHQLNHRATRNLLLLHLRKVSVADLPELPDYEGPASLPNGQTAAAAAAAGGGGGSGGSSGTGRLVSPVQSPGSSGPRMWSDVALTQQQQQQQQQQTQGGARPFNGSQPLSSPELGRQHQQQQQQQAGVAAAATAEPVACRPARRVMFADAAGLQEAAPGAAAGDAAAGDGVAGAVQAAAAKPTRKRIRFADEI